MVFCRLEAYSSVKVMIILWEANRVIGVELTMRVGRFRDSETPIPFKVMADCLSAKLSYRFAIKHQRGSKNTGQSTSKSKPFGTIAGWRKAGKQ